MPEPPLAETSRPAVAVEPDAPTWLAYETVWPHPVVVATTLVQSVILEDWPVIVQDVTVTWPVTLSVIVTVREIVHVPTAIGLDVYVIAQFVPIPDPVVVVAQDPNPHAGVVTVPHTTV